MKKIGLFSLLVVLIFSACRKDIDNVTSTTSQPEIPILGNWVPEQSLVNASLTGFVVDEEQKPIANARVQLNDWVTSTDDYGHFFFKDLSMNELGAVVKIEMDGYFDGSRRFFPIANTDNKIKVEMLPKNFSQSFMADAGANISVDGGASVEFAPNSIKKQDGSLYQGEVSIAAKWLDPDARRTWDQMPGNLQGVNTSNEEVALATFGMMAVELQGSNGEALNIADGATATLRMPVPANMQAGAPGEIPLWSFHEGHGIWAEESTASLQNGVYVGEVSHFSFWNCDAPFPVVKIDFRLIDENGDPLVDHFVIIRRSTGGVGAGTTNDNGEICGKVPADEELTIEVTTNGPCNNPLFVQTIGPFTTATSLGDITVPDPAMNTTSITGQLVDCNGDPVLNGLLIIDFNGIFYGNEVYEYLDDGSFDLTYTSCDNGVVDAVITAINLDGLVTVSPLNAVIGATTDLGTIELCNQPTTYALEITVDGETLVYPDATVQLIDSFGEQSVSISAASPSGNGYTNIWLNEFTGTGNYDNTNSVSSYEPLLEWWVSGTTSSFTVDTFGDVGEEVSGSFSGTMLNRYDQMNVDVEVSGSFLLIRQQ